METDENIKMTRLVKENVTRHEAPSALRRQILRDIRQHRQSPRPGWLSAWVMSLGAQWTSLSMGVVTGVLVTSISAHLYFSPSEDTLAEEVVTSHVRSLMVDHLSDVASTDQHTVKPWFRGKLDYAPPVQDFASQGFTLVGGRIDYVDHRAVSALVYRHKEHVINAFVWPTVQPNSSVRQRMRQGFNMIEWNAGGMKYWLVSDVSMNELQEFARITRIPPMPPPAQPG